MKYNNYTKLKQLQLISRNYADKDSNQIFALTYCIKTKFIFSAIMQNINTI